VLVAFIFLGGAGSANATTADDNVGLIVKKGNVAVKVTATRRPQKAGYRENARPAGCFHLSPTVQRAGLWLANPTKFSAISQ
jgi:hypothetical protein